jgi:hypothetical protein
VDTGSSELGVGLGEREGACGGRKSDVSKSEMSRVLVLVKVKRSVGGACECTGRTCRVKGIGLSKESSLVKPSEEQAGVSGEGRLKCT